MNPADAERALHRSRRDKAGMLSGEGARRSRGIRRPPLSDERGRPPPCDREPPPAPPKSDKALLEIRATRRGASSTGTAAQVGCRSEAGERWLGARGCRPPRRDNARCSAALREAPGGACSHGLATAVSRDLKAARVASVKNTLTAGHSVEMLRAKLSKLRISLSLPRDTLRGSATSLCRELVPWFGAGLVIKPSTTQFRGKDGRMLCPVSF
ncbi:hypothetical protein MTO96_011593 [Rhipicephalus appendiculatus]